MKLLFFIRNNFSIKIVRLWKSKFMCRWKVANKNYVILSFIYIMSWEKIEHCFVNLTTIHFITFQLIPAQSLLSFSFITICFNWFSLFVVKSCKNYYFKLNKHQILFLIRISSLFFTKQTFQNSTNQNCFGIFFTLIFVLFEIMFEMIIKSSYRE